VKGLVSREGTPARWQVTYRGRSRSEARLKERAVAAIGGSVSIGALLSWDAEREGR